MMFQRSSNNPKTDYILRTKLSVICRGQNPNKVSLNTAPNSGLPLLWLNHTIYCLKQVEPCSQELSLIWFAWSRARLASTAMLFLLTIP